MTWQMLQLMINMHKCLSDATFEETGELAQELSAAPAKVPRQALLVFQVSKALLS